MKHLELALEALIYLDSRGFGNPEAEEIVKHSHGNREMGQVPGLAAEPLAA